MQNAVHRRQHSGQGDSIADHLAANTKRPTDGSFTIEVDIARSLVRIAMAGFFGPHDIARFVAERAAVHAQLTCAPNQHMTLNDLRGMKIQSQDAVAAFRAILGDPAYRSKRLSVVVSQTLARSQLMRALEGRDARCFETVTMAEAWLLGA